MRLNNIQMQRSNQIHIFLKKQNPETIALNNIKKCETCNGLGLQNCSKNEYSDYNWDGSTYCDDCHGIGYVGHPGGMMIDDSNYVCRNCDSVGCGKCNMTGIVDWVAHSMGR
jgi:DnaJ-class molecular chaperone